MLRAEAAGGGGEPRGPFKEDWNPLLYGTDVSRAASEHKSTPALSVIVFVSSDAPVDRGRLTDVLERGADHGVHAVFVSPTVESLPAVCRSYVDVTGGPRGRAGGSRPQRRELRARARRGCVERVHARCWRDASLRWWMRAPVVHDSSDIPTSVMFLQLVDPAIAEDPQVVIERWRQNNTIVDRSSSPRPRLKKAGTLRAIIGQGPSDAMALDLRTQGPHALVGGTTGAGKSEFLQAWVLGMAAAHSPDRVTFLFVDYKGGSAFADCVELPHCVGLVTDLSPHLVRRALTSLRAELHHREHLLNRKKAKDLLELEKRQDPECPPALVLVIDEFAALASRGAGVRRRRRRHRPARSFARHPPDHGDAAPRRRHQGQPAREHQPAHRAAHGRRGRLARRRRRRRSRRPSTRHDPGPRRSPRPVPGRLVPFQSGLRGRLDHRRRLGRGRGARRRAALRRQRRVGARSPRRRPTRTRRTSGRTTRSASSSTLIDAADERAASPRPRRPWLDDLAPLVDLRDLPNEGDTRIPLALVDVPEKQLQQAAVFAPDRDGSLVIYGTSGSGKSTLLQDDRHGGGHAARPRARAGLLPRLRLGRAAARSRRCRTSARSSTAPTSSASSGSCARCDGEMDRRAAALLGAPARHRSRSTASSRDPRMPRILLLIDNYPEFKKDWEVAPGRGPFYRIFMRILGEGRTLGLHTVITADRGNAVPSAVAANISRRVVLRMGDPSQYMLLGVPARRARRAVRAGACGRRRSRGADRGARRHDERRRADEGARPPSAIGSARRACAICPRSARFRRWSGSTRCRRRSDGMPVFGVADDTLAPHGFEPDRLVRDLRSSGIRDGRTRSRRSSWRWSASIRT